MRESSVWDQVRDDRIEYDKGQIVTQSAHRDDIEAYRDRISTWALARQQEMCEKAVTNRLIIEWSYLA